MELERNLKIIETNLNSIEENKKVVNIRNITLSKLDLTWWDQSRFYFEIYFSDSISLDGNNFKISLKREIDRIFSQTVWELNNQINTFLQLQDKANLDTKANSSKPISEEELRLEILEFIKTSQILELITNLKDAHKSCRVELQELMEQLSNFNK